MQSYFITGTGTGVGKTVLAAAMVAAGRAAGQDVVPMKPVQTGARRNEGGWRAPDLDFCLNLSGLQVDPDAYRLMAPFCFEPPCSPHLAARRAGVPISRETLRSAFHQLQARHRVVIAEGAGGVLVPIDDNDTMIDVMSDFGLPVLVASSPRLGTLNHTLLTVHRLRDAGLETAGIVMVDSEGGPWGAVEEDNAATLTRLSGTPVLTTVPHVPGLSGYKIAPAALLAAGARIWTALKAEG